MIISSLDNAIKAFEFFARPPLAWPAEAVVHDDAGQPRAQAPVASRLRSAANARRYASCSTFSASASSWTTPGAAR